MDFKSNSLNSKNNNMIVDIEVISANPTGYLHIGHIRNGIIGLILGNVYKFLGYRIDYSYYVNNSGSQINVLGKTVFHKYLIKWNKKSIFQDTKNFYLSSEIDDCVEAFNSLYKDKFIHVEKLSDYKNTVSKLINKFSWKYFFENIKQSIKMLGFDNIKYYYEKEDIVDKHNNIVMYIKNNYLTDKKNYIYKKDEAIWLKTSKFYDDKDRVLQKSSKEFTYFASDILYHYLRYQKQNILKFIDIWGADHHGYINRMKSALSIYDNTNLYKWNFLITQLVKIYKDNIEIKMSKRMGTNITLHYLLSLIPLESIKYYLVNQGINKNIQLKINEIRKNNSENPLFYFQYGYVRILRIIEKIDTNKVIKDFKINYIEAIDKKLLLKLFTFKRELHNVITKNDPSILINYTNEFAKIINKFYESTKIIDITDNNLYSWKYSLLILIKNHYEQLFNIISINPVTNM